VFKFLIPELDNILDARRQHGVDLGDVESIVIGGKQQYLLCELTLVLNVVVCR
jgi:hypothetical protein